MPGYEAYWHPGKPLTSSGHPNKYNIEWFVTITADHFIMWFLSIMLWLQAEKWYKPVAFVMVCFIGLLIFDWWWWYKQMPFRRLYFGVAIVALSMGVYRLRNRNSP
jgi:uncharacterized membrane protein AbrB (regulator of aidB expression)